MLKPIALSPELTFRSIILGVILAVVLAASNTYLALKIGILTSASIPAAVVSMGVLRFFKNSAIAENNLVQTAASAGEAIAGGVVYTMPALIIIHYAANFSYWHNFLIALIGGSLGILFSVPLRRALLNDKQLRFPEAQAITKILQSSLQNKSHIRCLLKGGLIGALIDFAQSGLQIIAGYIQGFFTLGKSVIGFGIGFSPALIGAGYLIGLNFGISLLIGALIGYIILMPVLSAHFHIVQAQDFIGHQLRFIGIGSLITAGMITLLSLLTPVISGIKISIKAINLPFMNKRPNNKIVNINQNQNQNQNKYSDKDIPAPGVLLGIIVLSLISFFLLKDLLPFKLLGFSPVYAAMISTAAVLIIGFIFAAVCGYFSGLVGVTASPGSAIVIGGLLIIAFALRGILYQSQINFTQEIMVNACAVAIVLISVVTGIACIVNDNIQDLKVGQLVGSTPYKQQLMLFLGVVAASSVIPLLMQLLFNVYGIGGVFPHPGMDASKMLPAPVPSVLAAVVQTVFNHNLPSNMLFIGAGVSLFSFFINMVLKFFFRTTLRLSILGIAMGLYLPLASSTALFLGSVLAHFFRSERGVLNACGLLSGAALMDVLLAVPFALSGNPDVLNILPANGQAFAVMLGILSLLSLAALFYRGKKKSHSKKEG